MTTQADVGVFALPLHTVKENALMVNALQRCSTVVVQNSLREGFGLTVTEAMWKGVPVLGTHAWGLRQQIRDGLDGRLVSDPTDPEEIARTLDEMLADAVQRFAWGAEWAAARARVVSRVPSGTGVAAPARVIRDLDAALLGFPEVMTPMFVQPWRTRKSPRPFPSWPTCSS